MSELIESVRVPLHELQADVDYLIGRVVADGSDAPMTVASIKGKLAKIETALVESDISHADLCLLSRSFNENHNTAHGAAARINEWLKAQIAARSS